MNKRQEDEVVNPFKDYVKQRLREGNPITSDEMQEAFKEAFSGFFESAFKAELEDKLGYSRYDYKNKETNKSILRACSMSPE